MENTFTIKTEYEYNDQTNHDMIIKKEEDIMPKVEEQNQTNLYNFLPGENLMTIPWQWQGEGDSGVLHRKHLNKPFTIIREPRYPNLLSRSINYFPSQSDQDDNDRFIPVKIEEPKTVKKTDQGNFCKNYVGLLCSGFARTVLKAKDGSEMTKFIKDTLTKIKMKFKSLLTQDDSKLIDSFRNHIFKMMSGKKIRRGSKERDFKIRNTRELQSLWKILDKDSELTRLKKEALKEVVGYFFESSCYEYWLDNGMMKLENKNFFLRNKAEIQKKVQYPGLYKPKFNRDIE